MNELEKHLIRQITITRLTDYYEESTPETIVHEIVNDVVSHKPSVNVTEVIKLVDDAMRSVHPDL